MSDSPATPPTPKSLKGKAGPLSLKQRSFVVEYLANGLNATAAYLKIYRCSPKSAETAGPRLLGDVRVQALVKNHAKKAEERGLLRAEELEQRLQEIIDFDPRRLYRPVMEGGQPKVVDGRAQFEPIPLPELPDDVARALAGFDVEELFEGASGEKFCVGRLRKWKRWDPARALELAMKRRGMLIDRSQVEHTGSITVVTDAPPKYFDR